MKDTLYIVYTTYRRTKMFPEFAADGKLAAWTHRTAARHYTRAEAVVHAATLKRHLETYKAPDEVCIAPASGGHRITWKEPA